MMTVPIYEALVLLSFAGICLLVGDYDTKVIIDILEQLF